jgi:hypothetical protein
MCDEWDVLLQSIRLKKFDVKAPDKEDSKNKKCNCCSIILFDDFLCKEKQMM